MAMIQKIPDAKLIFLKLVYIAMNHKSEPFEICISFQNTFNVSTSLNLPQHVAAMSKFGHFTP